MLPNPLQSQQARIVCVSRFAHELFVHHLRFKNVSRRVHLILGAMMKRLGCYGVEGGFAAPTQLD